MARAALEWLLLLVCLSFQQKESSCFSPCAIPFHRIGSVSTTSSSNILRRSLLHEHRNPQPIFGQSCSTKNRRFPSVLRYTRHPYYSLKRISSVLPLYASTPSNVPASAPSNKNRKKITNDKTTKSTTTNPKPPNDMKSLLSRAVAQASANRERTSRSTVPSPSTDRPTTADTSTTSTTSTTENNNPTNPNVRSLKDLTRAIDEQLYANGPRGTDRGDYPPLDKVVQSARDNMTSLLGFNQVQGDWKTHVSRSTYNVAVVFGKKLVRDQVTVEYASRIRTLVRLWMEEKEFRPSLVCFCGGVAKGNHVSDADAGYVFFRHMCEVQGIVLDEKVGILIDNKSRNDEEAVFHITESVKSQYIPKWLQASPSRKTTAGDEFGEGAVVQKKVNVHFTLISTEYHLCNINDVHHRSPQRSLLTIMEGMGGGFKDPNQYGYSEGNYDKSPYDSMLDYRESQDGPEIDDYYSYRQDRNDQNLSDDDDDDTGEISATQGIVLTSWSFQYATYPYIYAKDDAMVFLGKCYLLGEELKPLLVNMKGVVDQKEFFQRDNYLMLASIRRSLVHHVEDLHKPRKKELHMALKAHNISLQNGGGNANANERDMIGVLEIALLSLGRCVDLVKPAGLMVNTVPKTDWVKALGALEQSMSEIRDLCDPDRPLHPTRWGKCDNDY